MVGGSSPVHRSVVAYASILDCAGSSGHGCDPWFPSGPRHHSTHYVGQVKLEDVEVGSHKAGVFTIDIMLPVFTMEPDNYFQVFVTQRVRITKELSYSAYVHLVEDERFNIFKHLGTFTRNLTDEDLVEYNSHVSSVFHLNHTAMPCFKLSRRSIVALFEVCHRLSKKLR